MVDQKFSGNVKFDAGKMQCAVSIDIFYVFMAFASEMLYLAHVTSTSAVPKLSLPDKSEPITNKGAIRVERSIKEGQNYVWIKL